MEVKARYKQTDVGVIPEDWEVKPLDIISFVTSGKRLPLGKTLTENETPHPYIRVTDMRMGTVSVSDLKFVPVDVFPSIKRYRIFKDDIFISVAGTLGIVGKIPLELDGANLTENADRITNITCSRDYLLHFLMSPTIQNTIEAIQTVGAQPKLALTRIRKFDIPVPPTLVEQNAIAEALSDADALIEALEGLLAKKRQVKQGAMQELLTGKKRLLGFSGEWEVRKLGEIAEIVSGGTPSTRIGEYWNGNINWCIPTDITSTPGKYLYTTEKRITELGLKNSSATLLPKGTLLLCSRATIGEVKIAADVVSTNQGSKSLICFDQVYNEFLYYLLLTMKSKLIEKAIGSTFLEITKKEMSLIEIRLPTVSEQTAIAEILSDMDAEIAALEAKLAKARQVKQGMMQELLTGRVRLIQVSQTCQV